MLLIFPAFFISFFESWLTNVFLTLIDKRETFLVPECQVRCVNNTTCAAVTCVTTAREKLGQKDRNKEFCFD